VSRNTHQGNCQGRTYRQIKNVSLHLSILHLKEIALSAQGQSHGYAVSLNATDPANHEPGTIYVQHKRSRSRKVRSHIRANQPGLGRFL